MKNDKLKILVVGAGVYVAGRDTSGYGTVLPALNELYREGLAAPVCVAATSDRSIKQLKLKLEGLKKLTGTDLTIEGLPVKGKDSQAYKKAVVFYKPDCAIVVVPDHLHFKVASDLIKQGVHTLVVKPLTPTVREAKKLIALAQRHSVYGAVEFHKRYDYANLKLKDIVSEGRIGEPLYINVEYSQRKIIPTKAFSGWLNDTNIFQYLGVHYVDIIYFVTGAEPVRALAVGQKNLLKKLGIDNYDSIQAMVEWKTKTGKKFISSFLTNWVDPNKTSAMSDQKIKVIGTLGRYESDQKNRGIQLVTEAGGIEDINPYFTQSYPFGQGKFKIFKGYGIESIKQFCKDVLTIKNGIRQIKDFEDQRPTFKEALISTRVVEAVNTSLKKNGSWIRIF